MTDWRKVVQSAWWIPAFAFSFLGGYIDAGFKIYPHEMGLGVSLLALLPIVWSKAGRIGRRPSLDWSVYALVAYMAVHLAASCSIAMAGGEPGIGSIVRVYVNGLWPLIFAGLFWLYGGLRFFQVALIGATICALIRVALGLYAIAAPGDARILLFAPMGPLPTDIDLRISAPALMALLTVWFYRVPGGCCRVVIGSGYVMAMGVTLLGGSRVGALSVFLTPFIWAVVQRRRGAVVASVLGVVTLVAAINVSPRFFAALPAGAKRSLSKFVVNPPASVSRVTDGSDGWHYVLIETGLARWTEGPRAFLLGNPVGGWRPEYASLKSVEVMEEVAARLASYENAFCTVAATLGLAGLLLFSRVLLWLYRPFARGLLKNGIHSQDDAVAFAAVQSLILYVGLCWIWGGFPIAPIVLGVIVAAAYADRSRPPQAAG